jgi:cytosine/adenosine deaminase-related metal-dependent hydrolase
MSSNKQASVKARWVFPGDADPIADATVEFDDGLVAAIHSANHPPALDLGNAAIIPGLINAHTHLEFSDLKQPLGPACRFTDWIRMVVAHRRESDVDIDQVIKAGIAESVAAGTTTIAEIATRDWNPDANDSARIVAFRECIAATSDGVDDQLAAAAKHAALPRSDRFIPGLSPHAPYTVHPDLFRGLTQLARNHTLPIAMHLFETRDELRFLQHADGPFVELLQQFGVWEASRATTMLQPMDYLNELATCSKSLIVHGNYLTDDECHFIAQNRSLSVVYCPRTHAWFGHSPHPWQRLLSIGANVTIGTDSRASNPDLSVFEELKWLARSFPTVAGRTILQMATLNAARALGLTHCNAIRTGQSAELTFVRLPDVNGDPFELLFHPDSQVISHPAMFG